MHLARATPLGNSKREPDMTHLTWSEHQASATSWVMSSVIGGLVGAFADALPWVARFAFAVGVSVTSHFIIKKLTALFETSSARKAGS